MDATFLAEYSAESYTIDRGELVTFGNRDTFLAHGVVSDAGSLFSAPVISKGQVRLLRGAPFLTTGSYPFHCPIHPGMTSVLNVTAAGSPLPADAIAPSAQLKIKTASLGRLAGKRRLRVVVNPSEAVDAVVKASAEGVALARVERTYVSPGPRGDLAQGHGRRGEGSGEGSGEGGRGRAGAAAGDPQRRRRQRPRSQGEPQARGRGSPQRLESDRDRGRRSVWALGVFQLPIRGSQGERKGRG